MISLYVRLPDVINEHRQALQQQHNRVWAYFKQVISLRIEHDKMVGHIKIVVTSVSFRHSKPSQGPSVVNITLHWTQSMDK